MPKFTPRKTPLNYSGGIRKVSAPSIVFIIFVALVLLLILVVLNELFGWSLFTGWNDGENEDGENLGGSILKRFSLY